MELRHLRYFIAVAEEENVTRAAARLRVSQPPLSRQIQALEDEIGVNLFDRCGRSIKLTQAGLVFLRHAKSVLTQVELAVKSAQAASGEKSALRVGYTPALTTELLPQIVRSLSRHHPRVQLIMHDSVSIEIVDLLRAGKLDVGLIAKHPGERNHRLHYEVLQSFAVGVIVSKRHRLARRRGLAVDDVMDEPIALLSPRRFVAFHAWTRRVLGRRFSRVRVVEECESVPSLIAAVECGRAIALCSEGHIQPARDRLAFVPFTPPLPPIEIGIGFLPRSLPSPPVQQFIETARIIGRRMVSS